MTTESTVQTGFEFALNVDSQGNLWELYNPCKGWASNGTIYQKGNISFTTEFDEADCMIRFDCVAGDFVKAHVTCNRFHKSYDTIVDAIREIHSRNAEAVVYVVCQNI